MPRVIPVEASQAASPLQPVEDQFLTLYVMAVFLVLAIAFWFLPGARTIIAPFKLYVIGWHELCHMLTAVLTGGKVVSVTIEPMHGGCTRVDGGKPKIILSSGYLGSTLLGGLYVFAAWHTLAAKITSVVTAVGLLTPLIVVRDKLTMLLILLWTGLLVGFWFIDHASPLRWYSMYVGINHVFFAVWDFTDDRLFKKTNDSDCTQFALLFPKTKPYHWALGWVFFEVWIFVAFILCGLIAFKRTPEQMQAEAAAFLPT
ncbi:hypothetical protein FRC02_004155 [Tulasnella sp. 418]|nr:hypothetical protein FRC02_004155 [Tulasnella sp. 418]